MRTLYVIAYDICDAKRLRRVHRQMKGFGDPLQYSIFRCELTPLELQDLKSRLWNILKLDDDRVMVLRLGPVGGAADDSIEYWGAPLVEPSEPAATIV
ncbi:CRISPR-associated endonuclease Cas2 [Stratiformator vulcanicus]|uniref:CRISPR-associated endoribonuclease Cas2 n=1 Tax=Stratiformator vulcanicus TaxID=2527980 RepID=A0A517QWQ6_9PLAN|nr:CRISPR-associated endonuclease Cas2 [Stratiformator vulcanicus]QDT36034.1 CRISPR-associated endoribonuclease Cas2 [Stratiformator vulcanicus]